MPDICIVQLFVGAIIGMIATFTATWVVLLNDKQQEKENDTKVR